MTATFTIGPKRHPFTFDPVQLLEEADRLHSSWWSGPSTLEATGYHDGLSTCYLLVEPSDNVTPLAAPPAPWCFSASSWVQDILETGPLLRMWLGRLEPGGRILEHADTIDTPRRRMHLPLRSSMGATFTSGGETVHMAPGDVWEVYPHLRHSVSNATVLERLHLVMDFDPVRSRVVAA